VKRTRLSRSFSRRPPSGLLNPDRTRTHFLGFRVHAASLAAGRRGSARRTGSPAHDPARGLSALYHHCRPRLSAWDTCDSWPDGQMVSKGLCRRDASLVELWAVAGCGNLAYTSTITFLQLSNLGKLLLFASKHPHRNGKDHPKMSHVLPRACFSLAWTPFRRPLSRAERPSHRVMQQPDLCQSHSSLQMAQKGARISRANSRPAS
jgi:hypothetical protein